MNAPSCDYRTGHRRCGVKTIHRVVGVPVPRRGVKKVCLCVKHADTPDTSLVLIAGAMMSTGPGDRKIRYDDIVKDLTVWSHPHRGLARVMSVTDGFVQIGHPDGRRTGMSIETFMVKYRIPGQPLLITV